MVCENICPLAALSSTPTVKETVKALWCDFLQFSYVYLKLSIGYMPSPNL